MRISQAGHINFGLERSVAEGEGERSEQKCSSSTVSLQNIHVIILSTPSIFEEPH